MVKDFSRINTIIVPGSMLGRATTKERKELFSLGANIKVTEPIILPYENVDKFSKRDRDRLNKNFNLVADDQHQEFQLFSK